MKISATFRKLGMLALLLFSGAFGLKAFHELTIVKRGVSWYMLLTYRQDVYNEIQSRIMQRLYPLVVYAFLCGLLLAIFLFFLSTEMKRIIEGALTKKLGIITLLIVVLAAGCFLGMRALQELAAIRQGALGLENYGDIEFHILQRLYPLMIYASTSGALLAAFLGAFVKLPLASK